MPVPVPCVCTWLVQPAAGTPEEALVAVLKKPRDWANDGTASCSSPAPAAPLPLLPRPCPYPCPRLCAFPFPSLCRWDRDDRVCICRGRAGRERTRALPVTYSSRLALYAIL